ncbi:hypothetical protein KJ662_05660 [Patescibacteria group bacterium]|nr:hypothetical protein [Patescibacteria group bacterium]
MIKQEIRSVVFNRLKKYDSSATYHPRIIDAECEAVLNQMYNEVFLMNPLSLQRFVKGYGYTTALAVLSEASTGIYYSALPENIVPIPDKASGVRRVAPATQSGMGFYPIDQREWDLMMSGSFANYVKNKIGYCVTPTRVEYYGMTGAVITSGVRMDCLIPFSEYTDNDVILVPEHTDGNGMGFIDRVVERFKDRPPVELTDDNSDKETK